MNKKIGLSDVKIEWLNKRALVLISIFAHAANKSGGHVVDLRSKNVLCQISSITKQSNDPELLDIYQRIKRGVKVSLSERRASINQMKEISVLASIDNYDHNSEQQLSI
jgi:hypothetical protein